MHFDPALSERDDVSYHINVRYRRGAEDAFTILFKSEELALVYPKSGSLPNKNRILFPPIGIDRNRYLRQSPLILLGFPAAHDHDSVAGADDGANRSLHGHFSVSALNQAHPLALYAKRSALSNNA